MEPRARSMIRCWGGMYRWLSLICFLIVVMHDKTYGQRDAVWAFGIRAGLDFNGGAPAAIETGTGDYNWVTAASFGEGGASICDENGQLLFYTEGSFVWNRNHMVMPGGYDITGLISLLSPLTGYYGYVTGGGAQNSVIVPMIDSPSKYFVFSLTSKAMNYSTVANPPVYGGRLYYSIVDMELNGGLGNVDLNRKAIQLDTSLAPGKMVAVRGNNCNIWLLVCSKDETMFKAYEITAAGINPAAAISVGGITSQLESVGMIKVSPDRTRLLRTKLSTFLIGFDQWGLGGIELYDFDAATGLVSNGTILDGNYGNPMQHQRSYYSTDFSPDNSKVYATLWDDVAVNFDIDTVATGFNYLLYQFDLANINPPATKTLISSATFSDVKRGPDDKMYYQRLSLHLDAINLPNLAGIACQWSPNAIALAPGTTMHGGLSNYVPIVHRDTITTSSVQQLCFSGQAMVKAASSTGTYYKWSDGVTGSERAVSTGGVYIVNYISSAPCAWHSDTIVVEDGYKMPYTVSFDCSAWVRPQYNDSTAYTYTWLDAAGNNLQVRTGSRNGDTIRGLKEGNYSVRIQTTDGCDTMIGLTVTPFLNAGFTADSIVCTGASVMFEQRSSGNPVVFSWDFGDGETGNGPSPTHSYAAAGSYDIMLVVSGASSLCSDTFKRMVMVRDFELGLFSSQALVDINTSITLTTGASVPYQVTAWEPAGLFADQQAVIQYPRADTTRLYMAVGISAEGCIDTASVLVSVNPIVFMPTAFSPNNDGRNDRFRPATAGAGVKIQSFHIYDRWGNVVWLGYGSTAQEGWDGSYAGTPATIGAYFYVIQMQQADGKEISLKGDVILVR